MYWRQVLFGIIFGAGAAAISAARGWDPVASIGLGTLTYITVRVALATRGRVRYWLRRGTRGVYSRSCGNCGKSIYRRSGDWILTCHRCGWKAGWPGIRWVTQSVPAIQFRRSISLGRLGALILAMGMILAGPSAAIALPTQDLLSDDDRSADIAQDPPSAVEEGTPTTQPDDRGMGQSSSGKEGKNSTTPEYGLEIVTDEPTATARRTPTPRPDLDGDGLNDRVEERIGTDPTERDSDGDRLDDYEEYQNLTRQGFPLPGADPTHKDLYLKVLVASNVEELSAEERQSLRELWAGMPVSNPSGEPGITLHINQTRVGRETSNGSSAAFEALREKYYSYEHIPQHGKCVVHAGLLLEIDNEEVGGRASAPGYFFIVDGTDTERYDTNYTQRVTYITHELLHNIVGEFDDGGIHTGSGWLYHGGGVYGENFGMAKQTRHHLNENGFDSARGYRDVYC